ncbi:MAG: hypothetical protein ACR2FV_08025 [Ornithinimicrobium sp.]|uniref:hypothetical protein n=1 Tax=Ornithinimicrobium sp. TaxID=1977084 RepID=UPI003D9B898C
MGLECEASNLLGRPVHQIGDEPANRAVTRRDLDLLVLHDLAEIVGSWDWLLGMLSWQPDDGSWEDGRIWTSPDGTYVVLEQSPALNGTRHDRMAPGMNHLALTAPGRDLLDSIREGAGERGWQEMFCRRLAARGRRRSRGVVPRERPGLRGRAGSGREDG